ncbi:MAG: branched-chain amino acid ABC transporter permease [Phycisphaerales bacterium]|nr:branched-chain amino acid ABC transporter permease [Phycisphaerales bacterium]
MVIQPRIGDFNSDVLQNIGINIILAVSLTIVNGFTGQFSMGHAGFMAVGGYVGAAVAYYGSFKLYGDGNFHGGALSWTGQAEDIPAALLGSGELLFLAAVIAGGAAAGLAGYLVGLPSLRLRGDYLAIVTLGFGEIVRVLLQSTQTQLRRSQGELIQETPLHELSIKLGGALGFISVPKYTTLFWIFVFVAIVLLVAVRLKRSTYGRAFLAIREDEVAAEAMGVPTTKVKVRAFVISAFFAGIAGALYAMRIGSINAGELGFQKSFDVIIMVVLGGMGSISGAVVAAIILTVLPELLRAVNEYRMIVYALLLILMMIVRPKGLFGLAEIWDYIRFKARRAGAGA